MSLDPIRDRILCRYCLDVYINQCKAELKGKWSEPTLSKEIIRMVMANQCNIPDAVVITAGRSFCLECYLQF